jgi:TetR/AcrR family transcriptional regulator, transcriptional repressor for nem operon
MSRTPNSTKEATHERIVAVAARAIREKGYAGVGVADVMKEAGLTHGGFYAHFNSRDELLVEALARAGRDSAVGLAQAAEQRAGKGASAFRSLVETYLSDQHLGSPEAGCPVAALGSEMPRQSASVRDVSAEFVRRLISTVRSALPKEHRAAATAIAGALVGSLQLARALGNTPAGLAALSAARRTLIQQFEESKSS